jgi:hypothetical protein
VNIFLWILAFFFGYTIRKEGEDLNLFKTDARMVLDGDGKEISDKIEYLNEQLADTALNARIYSDLETVDGDFSPVIQAALDSGYPVIMLPNWIKTLKTVVNVPNTVKEIRFNKSYLKYSKEQSVTGATYAESMFNIDGVDNLKISGGKFEYTGTFDLGSSYAGLISAFHITNSDYFHAENIEATRFNRAGINIAPNTGDIYCISPTIEKCKLNNNRVVGLGFGNTDGINILNNEMHNNGSPTDELTGYGLAGWESALPLNSIVKGNRTNYNQRKGIDFHAGTNGIIEGNYCIGNKTWGIFVNTNVEKELGDWTIKSNHIYDMVNDGAKQVINSAGIAVGSFEGQGIAMGRSSFVIEGNIFKGFNQINNGKVNCIILYADGISKGLFEVKNNVVESDNINSFVYSAGDAKVKGNYFDLIVEGNHFTCISVAVTPISTSSTRNRITRFERNNVEIFNSNTAANGAVFYYQQTTVTGNTHYVSENILFLLDFADEYKNVWGNRFVENDRQFNNTVNGKRIRNWDGRRFHHIAKVGESQPTTGYWTAGSVVEDMDVAQGLHSKWLCSQTGTPGFWRGA